LKKSSFYRAAVDGWPQASQQVEMLRHLTGNLVSDLALLTTRQATVAVHMEFEDPDVAYVGTLAAGIDSGVQLHRVSSGGKLLPDSLHVEIAAITKVEVATRYLTAVGYAARKLSS
jgi:hypothetical protein